MSDTRDDQGRENPAATITRLRAAVVAAEARAVAAGTALAATHSVVRRLLDGWEYLPAADEWPDTWSHHAALDNESLSADETAAIRRVLDVPDQPDPPAEPLLRAIYESWKADGHKVTTETGEDGKPRIRIHSPGEWRPLDVPDQPNPTTDGLPKTDGHVDPNGEPNPSIIGEPELHEACGTRHYWAITPCPGTGQ